MTSATRQHGVKGVYYGGEWLDLEDCAGKFVPNSCSGCDFQEACPRSRTRSMSHKEVVDNRFPLYDVCIIGAGCIGAAIARELSKFNVSILWLEAADDVSQGATKGNSGIVHAGYDDKPATNRSKHCWPGNQMFSQLDKELRFGYQVCRMSTSVSMTNHLRVSVTEKWQSCPRVERKGGRDAP